MTQDKFLFAKEQINFCGQNVPPFCKKNSEKEKNASSSFVLVRDGRDGSWLAGGPF